MTTLSQIVDELTLELVRPDLRLFIAAAANQTIREVHTGQNGVTHRFASNRVENLLTVPDGTTDVYSWVIPNFNRFQSSEAYFYESVGRFAMQRPPGTINFSDRSSVSDRWFWYQSGNYICFSGFGLPGHRIQASGFWYPRSLLYHPVSERYAQYDVESDTWTYRYGSGVEEEEAQLRSTNWVLMRWSDLVREGVRAKVFKRLGDQLRAGLCFSAYQDMRIAMQMQETVQQRGSYER